MTDEPVEVPPGKEITHAEYVMTKVLHDAEQSLRVGNMQRAMHVIFAWSQRKYALLDGKETWESQNIGPLWPKNSALPDIMPSRVILDIPPDISAQVGDGAVIAHAKPERNG